jgi:UDP-2,3-diacylglucosamine hydrolase
MRSTLLSDAHLRSLDDPNQARLVGFLDAWPTDELVLVGDVFDTWWGWKRAVYAAYVPILAALWRLRERGVAISWVGGNHDFAAGPVVEQELGIAVVDAWTRTIRAGRVLAVHGDLADRSLGQRALTRLLRGRPAAAAMRILGPGAGWTVSSRLSHSSREAGGPGLDRLLDAQRAYADALLADANVVCMGHSHAPGIETRARGRLINLGDWVDHYTFAVVDDDEVTLHQWNGATSAAIDGPMRRRI